MIKDVLKKYGDKVKYVYKHFPIHGEIDVKIAELVEAAGAQGKYGEFFDKIMNLETIRNIIANFEKGEINKQKAFEIAKEFGLDVGKFEEAIDKGTFKDKVNKHLDVATKLGIGGTPSVFINGKEYRGARSVDGFSQVIDEELKKSSK